MKIKFDSTKIGTEDYYKELNLCFKSIKFNDGDKETNVRVIFESTLKIFLANTGIVTDSYSVTNLFNAESAVRNPIDGAIYFIDSSFKNIIIEYKRYKRLDTASELNYASEQLMKYMNSDRYENSPNIYGFLFDGMQLHCFYKDTATDINKIEELSGTFNEENFDYFIQTLINIDMKDVTPHNLTDDFKVINNESNKYSLSLFKVLYNVKKNSVNKRTDLLFNEWEKMFKLSEADNGVRTANAEVMGRRRALSDLLGILVKDSPMEYEVLFALHTTYSILIKLIAINACKEFSGNKINVDFTRMAKEDGITELYNFLDNVEKGTLYRQLGITNMIQGDFFSWYMKENLPPEFYEILRSIFLLLSKYQNFSLKNFKTKDYLRELYENTIPREIRHSFGEYYTPYYLADCVIKRTMDRKGIINKIYKSLDPTCGSGTFVLVNISYLVEATKGMTNRERLDVILNNAYGIDLNPLAVLSSKINYLLNISAYNDYSKEIEIPIYLGDSSYMPSYCDVEGVKCIEYDFFTDVDKENSFIHFCLPLSLIKNPKFITIMDETEKMIVDLKQEKAENYLISKIDSSEANETIVQGIKDLISKLINLETQNLNSIWLGIFANYLKAATIQDCDIVAGNPPWVDWKNLPEKYREKLKISARNTNIFSDDTNTGGVSLNICALIALKSVDKYISRDGELAFLMPKAILFNKSFEGFRRLLVDNKQFAFKEIADWEKGGKPFAPVTMKFCIFNIGYKSVSDDSIPYYLFKLNRGSKIGNINVKFKTLTSCFTISPMKAVMLKNNQNNPISVFDLSDDIVKIEKVIGDKEYNLWHRGLGLYTPVHKLRYIKEHETDSSLAYFESFIVPEGSNHKRPSGNYIILEKAYVRPFVETPSLGFYKLNWDNLYTTYPYYEGQKEPIPFETLQEIAPRLANYLKSHQKELESQSEYNLRIQKNSEFYGIIRVGFYSYNSNYACMRDNNNVICCPILGGIKTHWDEVMVPKFDGHVSYVSERTENNPISEEEVLYLTAIINSKTVQKYIENTSDSQSIGSKFDINLPLYDKHNYKHVLISAISNIVYRLVNERQKDADDLIIKKLLSFAEEIYLTINDTNCDTDFENIFNYLKNSFGTDPIIEDTILKFFNSIISKKAYSNIL